MTDQETRNGEFLGFSFCLIYPRGGAKEARNVKECGVGGEKAPIKA